MNKFTKASALHAFFACLLASSLLNETDAAKCGKWYTMECLCESDERYCDDPALDNIKDQHPIWADLEGFYSFESFNFDLGGVTPVLLIPKTYGYFNHTIKGSRNYQHRYIMLPPVTDKSFCTGAGYDGNVFSNEDYVCGETGSSFYAEGFSTSTYERDGTLTSTSFLSDGFENSFEAADSEEYKLIPVDANTLFGSAANGLYFVTETFVFIKTDKSEANAVQDVFFLLDEQSIVVQSTRTTFKRLPDAETFVQMILDDYDKYNFSESGRFDAPMTTDCLAFPDCPTDEFWCEIDPNCSESPFQEPDSTINPGVIAGFLIAGFVIIFIAAYMWHRHSMATQADRYRSQFARRIAETVTLTSDTRQVTKEALLEEFNRIDNEHKDGLISKGELWDFLSAGKAGEMDQRDFNALFNAIDLDKNGSVDFLEFCAFMGKIDDDLETMKRRESIMASRPSMKATAASARLTKKDLTAMRLSVKASIPPQVMEEGGESDEEK